MNYEHTMNHEDTKTQSHEAMQSPDGKHSPVPAKTEQLAKQVIGAALEVHQTIGPGFPESVYEHALSLELNAWGVEHRRQAPITIHYRRTIVGEGRVDMLVGDCLVVELKTVEALADVHRSQAVAYLKALNLRLGLLINFHQAILKDGIKRVIN